jgi:glycosyltransferase involved in cell wall biosynthesis
MVTIGLVTYNRPKLLKSVVTSILNQEYIDFELLIGNDYPNVPVTFETLGIDKDPRVKIFNHPANIGANANHNYLLNLADTKWFTWMADDDLCHPQWLSALVEIIDNSDSSMVACYTNYLAGSNVTEDFFDSPEKYSKITYTPNIFISNYVSRKINLLGCYGLMKTKELRMCGGMQLLGGSSPYYADTLIPILLSQYGDIGYADVPFIFYRVHKGSNSASSDNFNEYIIAEQDYLKKLQIVCKDKSIIIDADHVRFDMSLWFAGNQFEIMSRNIEISRFLLVIKYVSYQLNANYSRIKMKYWFAYTMYIGAYLWRVIKKSLVKRIKKG